MNFLKPVYEIDIYDVQTIIENSVHADEVGDEECRWILFRDGYQNDCYKSLYVDKDSILEAEDELEEILNSTWRTAGQIETAAREQKAYIAILKAIRGYLDRNNLRDVEKLLVDVSW